MPSIGNHVDSIFLPESVNTSTTLRINGGDLHLDDNKKILLGQGDDLQIYHDDSNSYIADIGTGGLNIQGSTVTIEHTGGNHAIVADGNGATSIYYQGAQKFATTSAGISVTGNDIKLLGPTSGLTFTTSTLTLRGYRQSAAGQFGNIDFSNIDANSANTEYLAARISAQLGDGVNGGELKFFVTPNSSTTLTSLPALILHDDSSAGFADDVTVNGSVTQQSSAAVQPLINSTGAQSDLFFRCGNNSYSTIVFGDQTNTIRRGIRYDSATDQLEFKGANMSSTHLSVDSSGNLTLSAELRGPASFVIDPAAVGDNTGTVVIKGGLQVDGTTTTINSTTLTVDDLNIVLASGAANSTAADGAGITIDGANQTFIYESANDSFKTSTRLGIRATPNINSNLRIGGNAGGEGNGTTYYGFLNNPVFQSDVTANAYCNFVQAKTGDNGGTAYTITNLEGYTATVGASGISADSTITNLTGFNVKSAWTAGTNNYGFRGQIPNGTNRWNVYISGTAPNYFAGNIGIGTNDPTRPLHIFDNTNDANVKIEATAAGQDARLELIANSTGVSQIRLGDEASANPGTITYNHSDDSLAFRTGSVSNRLLISSGGKVTITTDTNNASPATGGDNLVIKDSDGSGISILSGDGNSQNIYMGSTSDNDCARLEGFYNSGSPYFNIYTAGSERLRIASDGAITVTSDGSDNDGANITLKHDNNNTTDTVSALIFSNNVGEVAKIVGRTEGGNNNGEIAFYTDNAGTSGERVRISYDGNVGIGTDWPTQTLDVRGAGIFKETSSPTLYLDADTTSTPALMFQGTPSGGSAGTQMGSLGFGGGNNILELWSLGTIEFTVTGSGYGNVDFAIDTNGNVGIGTDDPGNHKLHLYGATNSDLRLTATGDDIVNIFADSNRSSANTPILAIKGEWNGTQVANIRFFAGDDTTNKDDGYITFNTRESGTGASSERLRITSTGDIGIDADTSEINARLHIKNESTHQTYGIHYQNTNDAGDGGAFALTNMYDRDIGITFRSGDSNGANQARRWTIWNDAANTGGNNNRFNISPGSGDAANGITILQDNNVGIGTATPTDKLHVEGSDTSGISIAGYSTGVGKILGNHSHTVINKEAFTIRPDVGRGIALEVSGNDSTDGLYVLTDPSEGGVADTIAFQIVNNLTSTFFGNVFVRSASEPARLTVETDATSGKDAKLSIRGARTSCDTCDIGLIEFDNKTTSAYTMARIAARDPNASHSAQDGILVFSTGDGGTVSDAMTIDEGGRVGIGSTNPLSLLHVERSNTTSYPFAASQTGTYAHTPYAHEVFIHNTADDVTEGFCGIAFRPGSDSPNNDKHAFARVTAIDTGDYRADLAFGTRNTNFQEKMRIRYDGRVGIGTTDPHTILHVESTGPVFRMTDSNAATNAKHWDIKPNTANMLRIQAINDDGSSGGGNLFDFQRSGNAVNDFLGMSGGAYWFTIQNNTESVGIGTTTPDRKLHVNGDTRLDGIVQIGDGTSTSYQLNIETVDSGNNDNTRHGARIDVNGWKNNQSTKYGLLMDIDTSATDDLTANRSKYGLYIPYNTHVAANAGADDALAGTFNQNFYGQYILVTLDDKEDSNYDAGKANQVYGARNRVRLDHGGGAIDVRGTYTHVQAANDFNSTANTIDKAYGLHSLVINDSDTTTFTEAYGVYAWVNQDNNGTMTDAIGVYSRLDRDGGTATNAYCFKSAIEGTWSGKKYGVYLSGVDENYFSGNVGIGSSEPTTTLELNNASEPTMSLWTGATKRAAFQAQSTGAYIYSYDGKPMFFSAGNGTSYSEQMRIEGPDGMFGGPYLNAVYFNNTEGSGAYYRTNPATANTGILAFDENFHSDSDYGSGAYAPAQVFNGNGGGLVIKNEDGWGGVLTTQNAQFAHPTFEGIGIGQTRSGSRNVLDLGSGTLNRGISWGGTGANYCNIWAEYSSGDLYLGSGVRPTGTSTGFVSSYGGSSIGRSAIELQMNNGDINFYNATASTIADGGAVSTSLNMVIKGSGNVGIGTNNPTTPLHVVGDIQTSTGNLVLNGGAMRVGDEDGYEGIYFEYDNHAITWNDGTGNFNIRVGNNGLSNENCTEAGTIFQDEWSQSAGWRQFNVSSASLSVGNSPTWRAQIEYDRDAAYLRYQGSSKIYTTNTGVTVSGTVNETSDSRLKENIQDIETPLDKINALRGVKFDWIANGETDYGLIAQEVEQVIPELVHTETLVETVNKVREESEVKTLAYNSMIGILVEAVKELSAEVEALKAQISGS